MTREEVILVTRPQLDDLSARLATAEAALAASQASVDTLRAACAVRDEALAGARAEAAAAQVEAARLRLAFSNLLSEHTQSDDDPAFWTVHESDFGAAGRALTTFEHTETAAERGRALLIAIEAARGYLREGTLATRTVLEVALKHFDEVTQ